MAALAKDRKFALTTILRSGLGKVAASTRIYEGALLCRNTAGFIVPAADAAGNKGVGIALESVDNTSGSNGAKTIQFGVGQFKALNDGTNPVVQAQMHGLCYAQDDQTVRGTATANNCFMGVVAAIDTDGVLINMAPEISATA